MPISPQCGFPGVTDRDLFECIEPYVSASVQISYWLIRWVSSLRS